MNGGIDITENRIDEIEMDEINRRLKINKFLLVSLYEFNIKNKQENITDLYKATIALTEFFVQKIKRLHVTAYWTCKLMCQNKMIAKIKIFLPFPCETIENINSLSLDNILKVNRFKKKY